MFMTRVRLLHRTEGTFDCLATLAHRFWVCVKALLHSLEQRPELRYLHRPANLEDLFIKLTGRELRD